MSPIKDLTDSVRLPRLGRIRLGIRHPEKGYPMKTDYFVLDKEHSSYRALVALYGTQPKELDVMIPVEDEEIWSSQYYRSYNQTYGLVCKGDGEAALRMVDVATGDLPDRNKTKTVMMREFPCLAHDCPLYKNKQCHEVMNLRFILPKIAGLGVWQIDTGSKNSILNINSCARMIKGAFGRISLIPLKLTLEPMQVNNPESGKKQTVYVLNLRSDITIAQLADVARDSVKSLQLEEAYDAQVQADIDELWGDGKTSGLLSAGSGSVGNDNTPPEDLPVEEVQEDIKPEEVKTPAAPVEVIPPSVIVEKPATEPAKKEKKSKKQETPAAPVKEVPVKVEAAPVTVATGKVETVKTPAPIKDSGNLGWTVASMENGLYVAWVKKALQVDLMWTDVIKYLKGKYGASGDRVGEILVQLKQEELEEFTEEVKSRLECPF